MNRKERAEIRDLIEMVKRMKPEAEKLRADNMAKDERIVELKDAYDAADRLLIDVTAERDAARAALRPFVEDVFDCEWWYWRDSDNGGEALDYHEVHDLLKQAEVALGTQEDDDEHNEPTE